MHNEKINETILNMRTIQDNLLSYYNDGENLEENYVNLINLYKKLKIGDSKQELKTFLHLVVKIANNHSRSNNFLYKIFQTILFLKKDLEKHFSNEEIFLIFKENKRIILFLVDEKNYNNRQDSFH